MKFVILLLIVSVLLCGCGISTEPILPQSTSGNLIDSTTNSTSSPLATSESDNAPVFKVCDDILFHSNSDTAPIHGTKLSTEHSAANLDDRFADFEKTHGIFPSYGAITLVFTQTPPIQITWYINDGYGFSENAKGTVITSPSSRNTIYLRANLSAPLSSDLENSPPRKLRIVCQYLDRQIEYLMLIDATHVSL